MLTHHASGASKLDKRGRGAFVLCLAETVMRPDEAWLRVGRFDDQRLNLISRYGRGRDMFAAVAVFKSRGTSWIGWNACQSFKDACVESLRRGVALFKPT